MTGINLNIKKKKKMTNNQAFEILSQEREFANLTGWNFVRSIMSNFDIIRKEYEMAQQYLKPSKEFQEVLKLKHNILYKYAEKNDKGEPIIIKDDNGNSNYNILPDLIEAASNDLKQLEKYFKAMELLEKMMHPKETEPPKPPTISLPNGGTVEADGNKITVTPAHTSADVKNLDEILKQLASIKDLKKE